LAGTLATTDANLIGSTATAGAATAIATALLVCTVRLAAAIVKTEFRFTATSIAARVEGADALSGLASGVALAGSAVISAAVAATFLAFTDGQAAAIGSAGLTVATAIVATALKGADTLSAVDAIEAFLALAATSSATVAAANLPLAVGQTAKLQLRVIFDANLSFRATAFTALQEVATTTAPARTEAVLRALPADATATIIAALFVATVGAAH
jgi:hypothetical protein